MRSPAWLRLAFLLGALLPGPGAARADILFIDLHISNNELEAAQAAAEKRHERLVVIPKLSKELRKRIADIKYRQELAERHADSAEEAYKKAKADGSGSKRVEALQKAYAKMQAVADRVDAEMEKVLRPIPSVNSKAIREAIQGIEAHQGKLTSLVISGHSTGVDFWGDIWTLSRSQIKHVVEEFPSSLASLRSVFLWGCYSAEKKDVQWWKESLPKLKVVMGFSDMAPKSSTDESPALLQDALEREAEMAKARDLKEASAALRSLKKAKGTNAAAAINACYVGTTFSPVKLDSEEECDGVEGELKPGFDFFKSCLEASAECPDPPSDPHHSALRTFYSNALRYGHCSRESAFVRDLPDRGRVLALIFFATVRRNFAAYFARQIDAANQAFAAAGMKQGFPDLSTASISRHELLARIRALRDEVVTNPKLRVSEAMTTLLSHAVSQLRDLNCVPTTWITAEPSSGRPPAAPSC